MVRAGLILRAMLALFAALLLTPALHAQTYQFTNSTDSATNGISDTATPCTNRFKRTFSVTQNFTVSDVKIGVLMAHTYRGDLLMYLVAPDGTRIQLTTGFGAAADNYNVLFDDSAAASISTYTANSTATATTAVPPYSASYRPSVALSGFAGKNSTGTWTLEICDQYAQDSGTFYQSDLYLTAAPTNYADLSLTKTMIGSAPVNGGAVTWRLSVTNAAGSPSTANSVEVTDYLPAGFTFISASGTGTFNSATGVWSVGTLTPGQTKTIDITGSISATAGATITNTAEVTASSIADIDSTPGNGIATEDDYASSSFVVAGTRAAGTPPTLSCPVGSTIFDWSTATSWTAGSTSNSYALGSYGNIAFSLSNPGTWLNNAGLGGQSPNVQNVMNGGYAGEYSLIELVDLPDQSARVTTTITLPTVMQGAQFRIHDVDYAAGQFADVVTVEGRYQGATVIPTLTNGISNYVIGNGAYGDAASDTAVGDGNVWVTFNSPIDQIIVYYGDHALAPANPGQQAVSISNITFCNPSTTLTVSKVSSIVSDPQNGTTNPKAIPGAVMEYCITITNPGSAAATSIVASDNVPPTVTFIPGSMRSGTSCAGATTVEDDNNTGTDESDPFGASYSAGTVIGVAANLAASSTFALKFQATVN